MALSSQSGDRRDGTGSALEPVVARVMEVGAGPPALVAWVRTQLGAAPPASPGEVGLRRAQARVLAARLGRVLGRGRAATTAAEDRGQTLGPQRPGL